MRGEMQRRRAEERYAEYARRRDEGLRPPDAARDLGVGYATWSRYERSYRLAHGQDRLTWRSGKGGTDPQ